MWCDVNINVLNENIIDVDSTWGDIKHNGFDTSDDVL